MDAHFLQKSADDGGNQCSRRRAEPEAAAPAIWSLCHGVLRLLMRALVPNLLRYSP
jgi:hypothetical protein